MSFAGVALAVYDEVTLAVAGTPRGARARESARGLNTSLFHDSSR
ncbi:hypothetical protein ACFWIA_34915 [Streptomyces sp. NPDC127068]